MMNARTRNAPASTARGSVSHQDTARLRYRRYQSAAYGTSVLTICQTPRPTEGFWYRATICFQAGVSVWFSVPVILESFIITLRTAFYGSPKDGNQILEGHCLI